MPNPFPFAGRKNRQKEQFVNRFFYHVSYHWALPSPSGGMRSGFADCVLWFPSPMNHTVKVQAMRTTISGMMEANHMDDKGNAIVGLPDQFKHPKVTLISWTKIMEDRVPASKAGQPPEVDRSTTEGMTSTDGRDPADVVKDAMANPPPVDQVIYEDPPPAVPIPDAGAGVPEDSSDAPDASPDDAGTNAADTPEDPEPGTTSEAQGESAVPAPCWKCAAAGWSADQCDHCQHGVYLGGICLECRPEPAPTSEPEPDPNRPFRGTIKFPTEGGI